MPDKSRVSQGTYHVCGMPRPGHFFPSFLFPFPLYSRYTTRRRLRHSGLLGRTIHRGIGRTSSLSSERKKGKRMYIRIASRSRSRNSSTRNTLLAEVRECHSSVKVRNSNIGVFAYFPLFTNSRIDLEWPLS